MTRAELQWPPASVRDRLIQRLESELAEARALLPADEVVTAAIDNSDRPVVHVFDGDCIIPMGFQSGFSAGPNGFDLIERPGHGKIAFPRAPAAHAVNATTGEDAERVRPATIAEALDYLEQQSSAMVERELQLMCAAATEFIEPAEHRIPALERVYKTWPWSDVYDLDAPEQDVWFSIRGLVYIAKHQESLNRDSHRHDIVRAMRSFPPSDVALVKVIEWIKKGRERRERGSGFEYAKRCEDIAKTRGTPIEPEPVVLPGDLFIQPWQLAQLFRADRAVEHGRFVQTVKMSARREAQTVLAMMASGPKKQESPYPWIPEKSGRNATTGEYELVWAGKRKPVQLALLGDADLSLEGAVVREILAELREDGIRDWIVVHRMAETQGNTGMFRWSWQEHRERTDYASRVAKKNATDAELAEGVIKRLWRLKQAELRLQRTRQGKVDWVRLGPFGLIDIPAGRDELTDSGWLTTVAAMQINPRIYDGANIRARKPLFALVPEAALKLPCRELRLLALVSFSWAYSNGAARLRAPTLWEYAGIRDGMRTQRKRWPDAERALNRALDHICRATNSDWTATGNGANALYTIPPPQWWTDRVIYGVSPAMPSSLAGLPRTGTELLEWRKARSLSSRDLGALLQVESTTVLRAEKRGGPLPLDWLSKLSAPQGLTKHA